MRYGYIRPIVQDQEADSQLKNISIDTLIKEKHGLASQRTELENLLMCLEKEDKLYVQNMEVLADSIRQLLDILRLAKRDQITIHFIDEEFTNKRIQETSLLESLTFFAELQSTFSSHSSTFSLQAASEQGVVIGRPRKSDVKLQLAFDMYESKTYSLFDIKEATGISKSTLYRYLDSQSSSNTIKEK